MAMGKSPEFIEPGIRKEEFVEITIGDSLLRVTLASLATILGVAAAAEAKEALVEALMEKFGKYQSTTTDTTIADEDSAESITGINDIETNESDGSPDANKQFFKDVGVEDEDVATKSVTFKKAKFEALAGNISNKLPETEQRERRKYHYRKC